MGMHRLQAERSQKNFDLVFEMQRGVETAIVAAIKLSAGMSPQELSALYKSSSEDRRNDALEMLTNTVFGAITGMANSFEGYEDPFWSMALDIFRKAFDQYNSDAKYLSPFQQRLALMILDKLDDNLNGYYPAILRVLIWCVYPRLDAKAEEAERPMQILASAVHAKLQTFPAFAGKKPDKVREYLPKNVRYNFITQEFTHVYADGAEASTKIAEGSPAVDLLDQRYWRNKP
jgi:hypothetical protein